MMQLKGMKTFVIGSLILILLVIVHLNFGMFNRFNLVTAYLDMWNGRERIIIYGEPFEADSLHAALAPRLGFQYDRQADCVVTPSFVNGVRDYNAIMGNAISKRLGENWNDALDKEVQRQAQ